VITAPDREPRCRPPNAPAGNSTAGCPGVIGGYDSPARFLPSQATQAARRASLPAADELAPACSCAGRFAAVRQQARRFPRRRRRAAKGQGSLTRKRWPAPAWRWPSIRLLLQRRDGWSVLLPLRPTGGDRASTSIDAVRAALAGSGALFVDMKHEFDTLYNDYLHEATLLSLAGFGAIVALLAVTLRSPRRLAAVLIPLLIAVMLVIAGLHLAGERLHLLHLVGMLLIVAVGSNYALFFDRAGGTEGLDGRRWPRWSSPT
jgi:predicted exporter